MADQLDDDVPARDAPPGTPRTHRARLALLSIGIAFLVVLCFALTRHEARPMVITGAGAGTYPLISYERFYFSWVDLRGGRGVDTSFLVAYYSQAREPDAMRDEARRIAPALFPFADSAHLTKLWLKPTKGLPLNALPIVRVSYDVRFVRAANGAWREVSGW